MNKLDIALRHIFDLINAPVAISREEDGAATAVSVTASIGVTLFPLDDGDADTLLRHADQAMSTAGAVAKSDFSNEFFIQKTYSQQLKA